MSRANQVRLEVAEQALERFNVERRALQSSAQARIDIINRNLSAELAKSDKHVERLTAKIQTLKTST